MERAARLTTKPERGPVEVWTMKALTFDGCGVNMDGRRILTGARADWDSPDFKAAGALIAAAPDLLAALVDVMGWIDAPPQGVGERIDRENAHDAARAAIAKATEGRSAPASGEAKGGAR
jgi:hypothetical protein